jgi:hypothetical protein
MLSLALATPGVAQTAGGMSPEPRRYGPQQPAQEKPSIPGRQPYTIAAPAEPLPAPDGNRLIAAEQLVPGTVMGLGLFGYMKPERTRSMRQEPASRSRIAAVGLSVAF